MTTRTRACSTCGATFEVVPAANGRWPRARTCSPACRLAALDRLMARLAERRCALVELLGERGEA